MGKCCPPQQDSESYQRKVGMAAVIGMLLIGSMIGVTWISAHPEMFRRHLDFSAPQVHESHPMPSLAVDRG